MEARNRAGHYIREMGCREGEINCLAGHGEDGVEEEIRGWWCIA